MSMNEIVLYGGTYLNKGGAAIAQGTFEVLKNLNINFQYIVDPEPPLEDLSKKFDLKTIYRYSDDLCSKDLPSISPIYTFKPFLKCIINSHSKSIKEMEDIPIWHIGDSPFSDQRSYLSVVGQVIALNTLRSATGGKVIIGGISLDYPQTKIGELALKNMFKNKVDYSFIRGKYTYKNYKNLGVPDEKMSIICDFAFHLDKKDSNASKLISNSINESNMPSIALILREYSSGQNRENYIMNIRKLTSKLEDKGYQVFFIPTSYAYLVPENDQNFVEKILQPNPEKIINIKDLTPGEIISVFTNFEAIISARLHGAIYGTLAHVPTIHLYEGGKSLEVIGDTFGDIIPLIKISDFANKSGLNSIIEILDKNKNKEEISHRIKSCIEEARTKSVPVIKNNLDKILGA